MHFGIDEMMKKWKSNKFVKEHILKAKSLSISKQGRPPQNSEKGAVRYG